MQKDAAHNDIKAATTQAKMQSEQTIKAGHLQLSAKKNSENTAIAAANAQTQSTKVINDTALKAAKIASDEQQHSTDIKHDADKTVIKTALDLSKQEIDKNNKMTAGESGDGTGGYGVTENNNQEPQ